MTDLVNRQWLLARRPQGLISSEDFQFVERPVPDLVDGEVLIRVLYLSCDPTQRGWLARDTYLPAVAIGDVVRSIAVGEVVKSTHPNFEPGQLVQGLFGWQDYIVVVPGKGSSPTPVPPGVPIEAAMSVLGLNGLTAYFGLLEIGRPQMGETVVVSAAAGATGSAAGQIAKIKGCRVIGIAGGADKCRYVTELGFDAAIDYKKDNVYARLKETCPKGIDIYFDNVGGEILDMALALLALRGRIVLCGAIARYNDDAPAPGPRNYSQLIVQRGRMEGFIATDYMRRTAEAFPDLYTWMSEGKLKYRVDVQHGLENAPSALARLFTGENQGKQLVKIADRATQDA
jgi:NADPH-dependent curcumin reductase CurA